MKKKTAPRRASKASNRFPDLTITLPLQFSPRRNRILFAACALIAIGLGLLYVLPMKNIIGTPGFTLDDSWIHLNFARNLADYGSFSYFQDKMVTSGSTSPLYTFMLAILWKFFHDEFLISYALGIFFYALSAVFFYRLSLHFFEREHWLAAGATVAFLLVGKINSVAVSGMETTLFIFLLLTTTFYYLKNKQVFFAISAGLLLWSRPDGIILFIAIAAHLLYHLKVLKRSASEQKKLQPFNIKSLFTPGIIFFILAASYFTFHLALSGSFFPNTVAAKAKYYGGGSHPPYFAAVLQFYTSDILGVFIAFFIPSFVSFLMQLKRRVPSLMMIPVLFVLGMIAAYWIELPYLYQDGRYLIPTIPFFMITCVWGVREFFRGVMVFLGLPLLRAVGNALTIVILLLAVVLGISKWNAKRKEYYDSCRYIHDRQVTTAHWIEKNTPQSSVIVTHDIGAIAFYSRRRIVDMVGLVSPEMIPNIGDLKKLLAYMKAQRVTHVATLRNWFEVVNQNPIYSTNERTPEIMEVFLFNPAITHIMPQIASSMNSQAAQLLQMDRYRDAMQLLQQSYQLDPQSVRTLSLIGIGYTAIGDTNNAEKAFENALSLQGNYVQAMVPLARIKVQRKQYAGAIGILQLVQQINPTYAPAMETMQFVLMQKRKDSLAALGLTTTRVQIPIN